jgi:hypothetical protein
MASRQKDFYSGVYNNARAMGLSDAQARLAASQASLETGFGRSSVGNNYFGIKAGKSWNGPSVNAGTWENVGGQNINTNANFRSYDNPAQSLNDWSSTVSKNFPNSYWADDFDTAVSGLSNGRFGAYATDPNYGSKLRSIDQRNYAPDIGIMSAFDTPPTPTQRPSDNPFDAILTPAAYQPSFPATPSPVQREALPDVTPVAFDNGRFGTPQPASFDYGRFGSPTGKTGRLPASVPTQFDPERFGTPGTLATTPQQLQRGLLDQALDAGELPGLLGPAMSWPGQAPAPVAGYVDPRVTTQPDSINTAAVQPPEVSTPASPGMAAHPQGGLLGGPLQQTNPADFQAYADRTRQAMSRQNLLGGLGGGLLGGLTLGPIGAIAGGLLGKTIAQRNFFPEAPPANPNNKQQKTGYAALDSSGRKSYSESKQFRDAVDGKMSAGLW